MLRVRAERPRRRARKPRDELASPHSITSSARASRVGGTSRPSALAVLRLRISSTFVDCTTGRSAGFSPLRIRPGVDADLTVGVRKAASVANQAAGCGELAKLVDRGHRMAERQCAEL